MGLGRSRRLLTINKVKNVERLLSKRLILMGITRIFLMTDSDWDLFTRHADDLMQVKTAHLAD